ncbi:MAG: hypothetical protein L0206_01065 [Actinobacteria bacterium]|nr:hypothetical protein [Actinomycetota bacterium]
MELLLGAGVLATAAGVFARGADRREAPRAAGAPPGGLLSTLPDLPMGRPRVVPSYVNSPGYFQRDDPESLSEWTGRREVGPIPDQFFFAAPSAESLASAVLAAVREASEARLRGLMIRFEEFETILWPEFPASRPATNVTAADAWANHQGHVWGGIQEGLSGWGGSDLRYHRLSAAGVKRYTNFNLVEGVLIHAVDPDGREIVLDFAPSFVERNGRWKVYVYKE